MLSDLYQSDEFLTYLADIVATNAKNIKHDTDEEIHLRCPICGDSKKSLAKARGHYYKKTGTYYCFNCSAFMPGIKFASLVSGIDEKTIVSDFNRSSLIANIEALTNVTKPKANTVVDLDPKPIQYPYVRDLNDRELEYLSKRRITELDFFNDLDINGIDAKQGKFIFIPWFFNNKLLNYQVHNYDKYPRIPKYLFSKHGIKPPYGLNRIDYDFKYIVIFEGVFDSLFVKNGIAIGGKSLTRFQEYILDTYYSDFQLLIAFDKDEAGMSSMSKMAFKSEKNFKYFLPDLNGKKDINEFLISSKININDIRSEFFVLDNIKSDIELIAANLMK